MKTKVKEIEFYGDTLLGIKDENGQIWLAIRKVCTDIGLSDGQTRRQLENLKNDLVFSKGITNLRYPSKGGEQETTCIKEKFVTLWLAKISLTPAMQKKNPEAVHKLLKYQLEAADVLHKAFYETEEQKSTFHNQMGLDGRIEIITVQINNMESMLEEQTVIINKQSEKLDALNDYVTINGKQQQKLSKAAKDRVRFLLGGTHSQRYKENSRIYFKNLWLNFCDYFKCPTYGDLNPKYMKDDLAISFIKSWEYIES